MRSLSLKRPIIFFDLETTGTDIIKDRIVEMALVKLMPDGSRLSYIKRINPECPIPAAATEIHGIYDEDVKDAPTFRQIARELYEWMRHCDLSGYNAARFDLPLLAEEFLRAGIRPEFEACQMLDVQHVFYKMEPRTLKAAYRYYCSKELENAHSAEADILATIEVLEAQLNKYTDVLSCELDPLCRFLNDGEEVVDYARAMVRRNGTVVFNFGKHKNREVADVFTKEPGYYDWMMKSDFSLHTKQKISEILNQSKLEKLHKKQKA